MINRVIIIVLDSLGVGEMPDAKEYNDEGSNTLKNISEALGGIELPNMGRLGIGNIIDIKGVERRSSPIACFGKMTKASWGKDTTTGHWEIAGVIVDKPFPTFPKGFPNEIINEFKKITGFDVIGNKPASGTEIIKELGEEHLKTGRLILYTSADSVFQIAGHEELIPIEKLYEVSQKARNMLNKYNVARVIARPFLGKPGSFYRTERRRDFSLPPPDDTVLDILKKNGISVVGIGKIEDIFAGCGLTTSIHTKNNRDGMEKTEESLGEFKSGLIFTNLVDFDMVYGHRNDPEGYYSALKEFDDFLPRLLNKMNSNDMLALTADHGCDPTTPSTDHSREYVPLLVYGKWMDKGDNLGTRSTFADVGQSVAEIFKVRRLKVGKSFLNGIV